MDLFTIRIIFLASSLWGVYSLKITNLTVPNFVENGTQEYVLLDCEYEYEINDTKLVVKWFHNNDPIPVYQWIPEENTFSTTEKFGNRVSREHDINTGDDLTRFRALHLQRPTTEMSGKYSCQVTSMQDTATQDATMIIYARPKAISVNTTTDDDTVFVMCIVEGVYPVPDIEMYHIEPGQMDRTTVEDVHLKSKVDDDGFDVFLTTNISQSEFETGALHFFGCTVRLEGTEYKDEKEIPYRLSRGHRPGLRRKIQSDDGSQSYGNDPENLDLDLNSILNAGAEEPHSSSDQDTNDDGGAFSFRPSVAAVLILTSVLLVLCW